MSADDNSAQDNNKTAPADPTSDPSLANDPAAGFDPLDELAHEDDSDQTGATDDHDSADPEPASSAPTSTGSDDLSELKKQALHELSPLVGQLDQTPEERFKTIMMMIQASDDQSMLKAAYDAALQIKDEKERAQSLLDVVNEINYFTQPHDKAE